MSIAGEFSPADNSETDLFGFDFANVLVSGETITGTSWEIIALSGEDPTPAARLDGPAFMSGTISKQRLSGLVRGVTYELTALINTSGGNIKATVGTVTCES